jgi:hypothetical protein
VIVVGRKRVGSISGPLGVARRGSRTLRGRGAFSVKGLPGGASLRHTEPLSRGYVCASALVASACPYFYPNSRGSLGLTGAPSPSMASPTPGV